MEKYIAFGLYRKNEHGGHQEAMEPGEAKPVYLAKDVDALLHELRDLIQRCAGGHGASDHVCYRRDLCDKALALMAG